MARILVIDDDKAVAATVRAMLEANGYNAFVADGGRAALRAVELFAFDAIVVDMVMPEVNGLDVIKIVRADAPDVPIIAMSGHAFVGGSNDLDFFQAARLLGADHCLQKPFRARELVEAIESCRAARRAAACKVA